MSDAEKQPVRLEIVDGVGLVLIDSPPVNATSQAVRAGILRSILSAQADPRVEAVVIACEGRTFIAGGDIREFGKPPLEPQLPHVCNSIEALTKPVVAAVHGTALGGGFEIALSCHARVIDKKARIGLPEVKLGLAPGAGGTQRLPRIAGMLWALDVITSGRQVSAEEAVRIGVVDRLAQDNLREEAKLLARSLVGKPLRRTGALPVPAVDTATVASRSPCRFPTKKPRTGVISLMQLNVFSSIAESAAHRPAPGQRKTKSKATLVIERIIPVSTG